MRVETILVPCSILSAKGGGRQASGATTIGLQAGASQGVRGGEGQSLGFSSSSSSRKDVCRVGHIPVGQFITGMGSVPNASARGSSLGPHTRHEQASAQCLFPRPMHAAPPLPARTMSRPVPGAMGGEMRALAGVSAAAIDSTPAEPRATATARPTYEGRGEGA